MIYRESYEYGIKELSGFSDEASLEARILLEEVCGTDRNTLLSHPEREVSERESNKYKEYLQRRKKGEPIQYILGKWDFFGLEFNVNPTTLIPRQDTETLVEEALLFLKDGMDILDMCTGTGCILLSLLKYSNGCSGFGVDINEDAVSLARENADKLGIKARFEVSDMFENISGQYDLIVSNPPYIETSVIDTLDVKVKEYEPVRALDGGEDGLIFYRILCDNCGRFLKYGGKVFFEIGYNQGEAVSKLLIEAGFTNVEINKDLAGNDRVACGVWMQREF